MLKKVISSLLFAWILFVSTTSVKAEQVYDVPTNSSFKTFMNYKTITSKNSRQYKLQTECVTDENGLRTYNGRYTIALGNAFNVVVGDYVDVELSTGVILNCVVGDIKQNRHTDSSNMQVAHNGNVVEFIVDNLPAKVKSSGNISKIDGFEGYVESITVYEDSDLESIDFERNTTDSPIVMDKFIMDLPDGTIVYNLVVDDTICVVDEDIYNSYDIGCVYEQGDF